MEIKKSTLYIIGIIAIIIVGGGILLQGNPQTLIPGNVIAGNSDAVQEVTISLKNYNYYPQTVTVKAGFPVRVNLDDSVQGCFRDFTIRELGVRKYLASPSDTVEFTPTKKGTYSFACSMGMGTGTLIVE